MSADLIKTIVSTIARHRMVRAGDRVGIGVSGGSDSVALLRILHALREQQGILLSVVHFNHGLRGADSDDDERFVAELATQLGLPLISGREDVAAVARAKRWNLEDAARRLRYGFFASLVTEGRIDLVAVGHTADDQAETVLARLARGTAPAGLSAIYPVKGHVVRPFIDVRRADLREHLHSIGQPWREDATNYDASRLRSRLRQRVLPMIESEIQPAIVRNLGRLAALSRRRRSLLEGSDRRAPGRVASARRRPNLHPLRRSTGSEVAAEHGAFRRGAVSDCQAAGARDRGEGSRRLPAMDYGSRGARRLASLGGEQWLAGGITGRDRGAEL